MRGIGHGRPAGGAAIRAIGAARLMAAAIALALPAAAMAQDVGIDVAPVDIPDVDEGAAPKGWRTRIGLGVGVRPDYVGSDDYEAVPLPQLTVWNGPQYVNLTGTYLFSNLVPSPTWRFGPTAKFIRGDRCNADDGRVSDMRCQADAVMLGATAGYAFPIPGIGGGARLTPALEVLADVAGANDGTTIEPQLNYASRLAEGWRLGLRAFGTWGSDNYNEYYFGVNRFQSADSGLPRHSADAGFYQAGLLGVVDYDITDNWKLSLIGRYARLVGDAEDSPIVDGDDARGSANQFLGGTVVSYAW